MKLNEQEIEEIHAEMKESIPHSVKAYVDDHINQTEAIVNKYIEYSKLPITQKVYYLLVSEGTWEFTADTGLTDWFDNLDQIFSCKGSEVFAKKEQEDDNALIDDCDSSYHCFENPLND